MIEDVISGWLFARSDNLNDMSIADLTLALPTKSGLRVYAEIMLTALSQGGDLKKGVGGTIATRVVRGTVMGKNGLEFVDIAADPANNSAYFDNCLAVDFRLGCVMAEAYANANVWYYGKPTKKPLNVILMHLDVVDRKTGEWKYSRLFAGPRKRLPTEELASRLAVEQAAELRGVPASSLKTLMNPRSRGGMERKGQPQRAGIVLGAKIKI